MALNAVRVAEQGEGLPCTRGLGRPRRKATCERSISEPRSPGLACAAPARLGAHAPQACLCFSSF